MYQKKKNNLIKHFVNFRAFFSLSKVNLQRSLTYVSLLNSGMILFLLLSKLQEYGISIHITKWFFPLFLGSLMVMATIGYLDYKLGFHTEESRVSSERNPYFTEIISRLDKIEKKLANSKRKKRK